MLAGVKLNRLMCPYVCIGNRYRDAETSAQGFELFLQLQIFAVKRVMRVHQLVVWLAFWTTFLIDHA